MSIEDIQAKRAARKAAAATAREAQYEKDLEALDAAEEAHGDDRVTVLDLPAHVPGLPTLVIVKTPESKYFKRFRDMARKRRDEPGAAVDLLAGFCVEYPSEEIYKKVCDAFPGTHDCVGAAAVKLAEAKDTAAGKG